MEQKFKRCADSMRLPEESRMRIRAQIASHKEQEASMKQYAKRRLPRLAVAAIVLVAALSLTAAAAAIVHRFRNDILVPSIADIPQPEGALPVAVSEPSGAPPRTLDEILEMIEPITKEEWESGEKIGGGSSSEYTAWDASECISSDPSLSIRRVTRAQDGAEKLEYKAEDPAVLSPLLEDAFHFDLTWLGGHFTAIAQDNIAYVIHDTNGAFAGLYFHACYGASDKTGWVAIEAWYDAVNPRQGNSYIVDGSFEEAYYYTTKAGYEFLITADTGTVWADCVTDHAYISLYGAYLTTRDMQRIVESLDLSIAE